MPSSSVAIAVASRRPIQIGRLSLLSRSLRITMGVCVSGSRVSPPTLISSAFSRLIVISAVGTIVRRDVSRRQSLSAHQPINHAIELIQVAAFFDDVAERQVAIHLTVPEAPRQV